MAQQQLAKEDRSIGELFGELASDMGTLVRQEVALAQVEVTNTATRAGKGVGFLAVGGAIGYLALMAVTAAIIMLLSTYTSIPAWASALIVGVVIGVVAFLLISAAIKKLKSINPVPSMAIDSIKEDAQWLKKEVM